VDSVASSACGGGPDQLSNLTIDPVALMLFPNFLPAGPERGCALPAINTAQH
jgi:hypothetical protein